MVKTSITQLSLFNSATLWATKGQIWPQISLHYIFKWYIMLRTREHLQNILQINKMAILAGDHLQ